MKTLRAVIAAVCCASVVPAGAETRVADISQGTNISIALSPDGQTVVVDLLGGLWHLPADGGGAVPLVSAGAGVRNPRFAPDERRVVYQRLVGEQWDLWLIDLDDGRQRPLTSTPDDEREPDFLPDGRSVVFSSNRTGRYCLWTLDLETGALTQLTDEPGDSVYPSVSERGLIAYVNHDGGRSSLRVLESRLRGETLLDSDRTLSAPSWRPGGGVLVYNERDGARASALKMLLVDFPDPVVKTLTRGEDVFPARSAWLSREAYLYAADGGIWRRGIAAQTREAVHMFAAVTVDLAAPRSVDAALDAPGPHPAAGIAGYDTDGERTVFAALGDLWLAEGRTVRRLSDDPFVDMDPVLFPRPGSRGDAGTNRIVYASDRGGRMALWLKDLDTGDDRSLVEAPGKAYRPAVDPTGRYVAYLTTTGFGSWSRSALGVVEPDRPGSARTLADDLYDVGALHWTRDAVEPRITVEARDGPGAGQQWSSFDLGGLRLRGDPPDAAPSPALPQSALLVWTPAAPPERYVIQAGRLFDGIRNDYRRHVDIHIEGQRIAAIVGRGVEPLPDTVVDMRDATVIPGLIDVHAHQSSLLGERLGRVWLANGVTTVREITDRPSAAIERAEAWASGRRPGPRLVISPLGATPDAVAPAPPAPAIVVQADPRLGAGLGHEVVRQWRQMGLPMAPRHAELERLTAQRTPASPGQWRISPLNASYQDVVGTTIESGSYVGTALAALSGAAPADRAVDAELERFFDESERRHWQPESPAAGDIRGLGETLARIVRSGGRLAAGSDAPAVPYGYGLQLELELLAAAGIANDQVLRLASAEGAIALGLDRQLGTLEAGKLADMAIVDGDPLARIADSRRIVAVVKGGILFERPALLD